MTVFVYGLYDPRTNALLRGLKLSEETKRSEACRMGRKKSIAINQHLV